MDKRIQNIEHDVDGWWIYLRPGFAHVDGTHAIVEDTKREALSKMGDVEPCECAECQMLLSIIGASKVFA